MAKRTAIIDIGSNSARLVIFQKTSKYGFHLICEQKSRVRIGEGAYENAGNLQKIGTDRAYLALESFSTTVKEFAIDKWMHKSKNDRRKNNSRILCVMASLN